MKKDAYYFIHDFHARTDEKILKLLMEMKWEGYGIYWAIIEKLHESGGWLNDDVECLAFELRTECDRIAKILKSYSLFQFENGKFTSERVLKNLEARKEKSKKAKQSAEKRWGSNADAMRSHNERNAMPMLRKERKGKEKKEEKTKDSATKDVAVTDDPPLAVVKAEKQLAPHQRFVEQFGQTYTGMTNQPFKADVKHYTLAAKLLKQYGEETLIKKVQTLGRLCDGRTAWFTKGGWADFTIEKLSSRWNEILETIVPDENAEMLATMRRLEEQRARDYLAVGRNGQNRGQ